MKFDNIPSLYRTQKTSILEMPYVTVLNIVLRCKHAPLLSLAHIRQIDSIYGLTLFTPPKAPIGSHIGCFISLGQPGSRVWGWNK